MVSLFTELAGFRADNIICIEFTNIAAILGYIAFRTKGLIGSPSRAAPLYTPKANQASKAA